MLQIRFVQFSWRWCCNSFGCGCRWWGFWLSLITNETRSEAFTRTSAKTVATNIQMSGRCRTATTAEPKKNDEKKWMRRIEWDLVRVRKIVLQIGANFYKIKFFNHDLSGAQMGGWGQLSPRFWQNRRRVAALLLAITALNSYLRPYLF